MNRVALFLLLVLSTGCATGAKYDKACASWIGSNSDALIVGWGIPTNKMQLSDGRTALEFFRSYGATTYAYGGSADTTIDSCRTTFFTDKENIVRTYQFVGNACISK